MSEELVTKLIQSVQSAAPVVWEAALTQAWLSGWTSLLWGCLWALAAAISVAGARELWKSARVHDTRDASARENMAGGALVLCFVAFLATLAAARMTTSAVETLANPSWHAIRLIIGLAG